MIQFECISRPFSSCACICFSNWEPVNEIIENIHYATVYFFHSICAVCLPKYLTVMTLRCDEWRICSPFLSYQSHLSRRRTPEPSSWSVSRRRNCRGGSDQQPSPRPESTNDRSPHSPGDDLTPRASVSPSVSDVDSCAPLAFTWFSIWPHALSGGKTRWRDLSSLPTNECTS